jgi:exopolysaccharide biosynthesis polyprenyl glycosylphosphotransferase
MQEAPAGSARRKGRWSRASRRQRRLYVVVALVLCDAFAILLAGFAATRIRFGSFGAPVSFENTTLTIAFWEIAVFLVPLWVLFLALARLYDIDSVTWGISVAGRVTRALSLGVVALILGTYLAKLPGLSRGWTLLTWILAVFFVLGARGGIALAVAWVRQSGRLMQPTLVVGSNAEAVDIVRVLRADPAGGLVPVACLASSAAERISMDSLAGSIPVVGTAREVASAAHDLGAEVIIIASTAFAHDVVARMIAELRTADVDVHISSGLFEVLTSRVIVTEVAGVPLITVKGISLSKGNVLAKRLFDLVVSLLIVLVGLPIWLLIAAAVKFSSSGPILYAQERVGRQGKTFGMYKFRSMYADADSRLGEVAGTNEASGPLFKMKSDPRVTPVGKWLRKFSLDEIPQLINVVMGQMSLVGPRPPLPSEVDVYTKHDWRRLEVVPGMTGLWQVSGRSSLTFDEMVRLDLFYIENWSVGLDLTLIFRTIPAVLFARGAY